MSPLRSDCEAAIRAAVLAAYEDALWMACEWCKAGEVRDSNAGHLIRYEQAPAGPLLFNRVRCHASFDLILKLDRLRAESSAPPEDTPEIGGAR